MERGQVAVDVQGIGQLARLALDCLLRSLSLVLRSFSWIARHSTEHVVAQPRENGISFSWHTTQSGCRPHWCGSFTDPPLTECLRIGSPQHGQRLLRSARLEHAGHSARFFPHSAGSASVAGHQWQDLPCTVLLRLRQ